MSVTVRNQIIEELFTSKEFNDCINKMEPEHLRDDLRSEVALIMLEQDESKLIKIYKSGGIKFFAVRIILNLIQSKTSPFYKKYRQINVQYFDGFTGWNALRFENDEIKTYNKDLECACISEVEETEIMNERMLSELREEKVLQIIDGLYWYDKELVKLYIKLGNYRDIEKETGIKWQSCYDTIQTAIGRIRYELRKSNSHATSNKS